MEIIDAQVHRPTLRRAWPEFYSYLGCVHGRPDQTPDHAAPQPEITDEEVRVGAELLLASMDAVGVNVAMIDDPATDFSQPAQALFPARFGTIRNFSDPAAIKSHEDLWAEFRSPPSFQAIRLVPDGDSFRHFSSGAWDSFLAGAEREGIPVIMFLSGHLDLFARFARDYPSLRLAVNHFGMPGPLSAAAGAEWMATQAEADAALSTLPDLLALAAYPNVAVQAIGLPSLAFDGYPFDSLWPAFNRVLEAFGCERIMWGTDFQRVVGTNWDPPVRPPRPVTYAEQVAFLRYTNELSESDKRQVFATTARTWFDLPAPTDDGVGQLSQAGLR